MIETVYIENQIKKHPRTKEILSRFKKKINIVYCKHFGEIFNFSANLFAWIPNCLLKALIFGPIFKSD